MVEPSALYEELRNEMSTVLIGNEAIVERLTVSLLVRGHVLMEGVPGVAKTTIAKLFARTSGLDHNRIQMTPDVVPADVTGTHIYREGTGEFDLQRGPIFANLVVADEINRATPKTQSALLEAMEEGAATIEGETFGLPAPFMVVATMNPLEMEGVYALPEAQRDRFTFKLSVEIPDEANELALLDRFDADPDLDADDVQAVVSPADVLSAREVVDAVHVESAIKQYILDLVRATRTHADVEYGASPRASLALLHGGKAKAAIEGREYVIPDDVKELVEPAMSHRIVLEAEAELAERTPREIIREVRDSVAPPGADEFDTAVATGDGGRAQSSGGHTDRPDQDP